LTDQEDLKDVAIIVSFLWSQEDRTLHTEAPGAINFFPLCHFLSNNYRFWWEKRGGRAEKILSSPKQFDLYLLFPSLFAASSQFPLALLYVFPHCQNIFLSI
jgi:hypothetical protein